MATTRIIPMHINKGKPIAQCMTARLDYVKNPDKTAGGELVCSYACAPQTADREFMLSRDAYLANTGRHAKEIEAHKAAEQVYQKANGQLPTLAELSDEYDRLLHQKRDDSAALAPVQSRLIDLQRIKRNIDIITDDRLPDTDPPKQVEHTVR